jgi:molybdenum cofactor cytidylyltransferase
VAAAPLADPELVGLPGRPRRRISQIHLITAALAADPETHFGHIGDSIARCRLSVYRLAVIAGVVLAGGKSSRMGRPKALLPIGSSGETFLDRVTRTLFDGGVDELLVVVGGDAEAIKSEARQWPCTRIVVNSDYERGQLTSLVAALGHIDPESVTGVAVTLVDVPLVSTETVQKLIAAHRLRAASIVRPVSNGRHGHPVIFHSRLFDELCRTDPAQGAKVVVRAHAREIEEVPVDDEGAFIDIDTREEYQRWIGPLP